MAAPLTDLIPVIRGVLRLFRYAGFLFLGVTLFMIGREVAALTVTIAAVHPALAVLFDLCVALLVWRLLGVPVWRFLRLPVVMKAPRAPDTREEWKTSHVAARFEFLARYLRHVARNPLLAESKAEVLTAARDAAGLSGWAGRSKDAADALASLETFEHDRVDPILAPLDREADRLIRNEALAVGVSTAISPNGTLDAFLVLWRNANLVSRLGNLYYGKPGIRGNLLILRDVSSAALLATYLEGLAEAAGGILHGVLGSVAGVLAGPLMDGSVNALVTLRIGYLARARCRSFRAWTEATRKQALRDALAAARRHSGDVVAEIAKRAGGAVAGVTARLGSAVKGGVSALFRRPAPSE